jgi:hypothetical protein
MPYFELLFIKHQSSEERDVVNKCKAGQAWGSKRNAMATLLSTHAHPLAQVGERQQPEIIGEVLGISRKIELRADSTLKMKLLRTQPHSALSRQQRWT